MKTDLASSSIVKPLVGLAAFVIVIYGMRSASSILSPILLAAIVGISAMPLAEWLHRKGLPQWLALLVTIIVLILGIVGLIAVIGISVSRLISSLPQYQDNLQEQIQTLQSSLSSLNLGDSSIHDFLAGQDPGRILSFVGSLFGGIMGSLSQLVILLMVLIFLIVAGPSLSIKLVSDFPAESPGVARFRGLARDLRQYVSITTWINFLVGLVNAILLILLGVDFPILWGVLAFLMGYIPNVGFWIALIPPFFLALLEFGAGRALIVLVGYILINGGVQNFLQPKMMGAGLNLSTLVVVVSLFFWGWVLGPMGALLAVPMTMVVKEILLDAYDDTRGLADLMSADQPVEKPAPATPAK